MIDQSLRSGPRLTFGASLVAKALPRFTIAELYQEVQALLQGTGAELEIDETQTRVTRIEANQTSGTTSVWSRASEPPRVGLMINGVRIVVEGHDRPAITAQSLRDLDFAALAEGHASIIRARAHVEVSELRSGLVDNGDVDGNYDRATALTIVAQAVTHVLECPAVIWHSSGIVLPANGLDAAVSDLRNSAVPVALWLNYRKAEPAPGRQGRIMTRGLYPLLGAEIEVMSNRLPPKQSFEVALDMAARLSAGDGVPSEGEHVRFAGRGEFQVGERTGDRPGSVPVLVLRELGGATRPEVEAGAA